MICVFPSGTDLVLPEVTANKITESDPAVGYVGYRHHSAVSAMCVMRSKRVLRYEFSCKHLIIITCTLLIAAFPVYYHINLSYLHFLYCTPYPLDCLENTPLSDFTD